MWQIFATLFAATLSSPMSKNNTSLFSNEQIIFSSSFNITKILVPANGNRYIHTGASEIPSVFFTVTDPKLEGGACIYVLEDFAAYEILEGGRDSTADYSSDKSVYFGARDGIYKYDADSLSAKKLGPFRDDVIQLQKANGTDKIYILTESGQLFILENNGTVRTRVTNVVCAIEFVLDTSNNVYFVECGNRMIHIIKADGTNLSLTASVGDEFDEIKLLRPAFMMEKCIPFFGDGVLYILNANGTCEKKDLRLLDTPSAFSVDAALYLIAALDGKIYEFNVMEVMLQSMFGVGAASKTSLSHLYRNLMSVKGSAKDGIFEFYKVLDLI